MTNLGDFQTSAVIDFMWNSNGVNGASITRATNGAIRIYKNNSATERTSSAGITDTEDFDSLTGVHHLRIDTSDNTDAGFYAAGSTYHVVLQGAVIDGKTVNACLARFTIGIGGSLTSDAVQAIWDALTSAFSTSGSIGKLIKDYLTGDSYARLGAPAGANIAADIAAAKTLTSGERNSIADALLDRSAGIETGYTFRQASRLMLAALCGKVSGASGTVITIRDVNDTKDRLVATVTSDGDRTAVTKDAT